MIDEYDKAILDNLDQMEVAHQNREIIKSFYGVTKDLDRYIRFVFLTGVSKFSKASIFSGLNNLEDISLTPKYGNICGYTQNDIETTILPYLEGVDLAELKLWYNGYNFLGGRVYNPYDILLFIRNDNVYRNYYWFTTGTPSFLLKLFKQRTYNLATFENLLVEEDLLNAFDIENIHFETVMLQSGYLTIKEVEQLGTDFYYTLTFPNIEVKKSFNDYILSNYFVDRIQKTQVQISLYRLMAKADLNALEKTIKSLFASIAYNNFTNNEIQNYEGFYASVIYAYFAGAGFNRIIAEDVTNAGRIDLSVFLDDKVFIFEFKVDQSGALEQIRAKNYHQKYLDKYQDIYLIGVEFDTQSRNVINYEWDHA